MWYVCNINGYVVRSNSINKTMAWCQVWGHQGTTIHGEWWVITGRRSACHSAESLFYIFMNIIDWGLQVRLVIVLALVSDWTKDNRDNKQDITTQNQSLKLSLIYKLTLSTFHTCSGTEDQSPASENVHLILLLLGIVKLMKCVLVNNCVKWPTKQKLTMCWIQSQRGERDRASYSLYISKHIRRRDLQVIS